MPRQLLKYSFGVVFSLIAGAYAIGAQFDPASLPSRDSHQGLLVAADPYTPAGRYKEKFGKHTPYEGGVVAIDLYFRNDGAVPLKVDIDSIRLLIGAPGDTKQKLNPVAPNDVADLVLLKGTIDPKQRRLPLPLPGEVPKSRKGKTWDEFAAELRAMALASDVIAPKSLVHGFLYFDINGKYNWLAGSKLELPDVTSMLDDKPLLFFEIDITTSTQ